MVWRHAPQPSIPDPTRMYPAYNLPRPVILQLALAVLFRQKRSFGADARLCLAGLRPPLRVEGREHVPEAGPCLLTVNHYSSPSFKAWWLALAISAVVPCDVHWTITAALTYPDWRRAHVLTPASRWLLRRLAQVYDFTALPAMPPNPAEVAERAEAVRRVLAWTRQAHRPIIGLAPEGRDTAGGALEWPAPGAGRFIWHLARLGLEIVPIGACEAEGVFCLRFGAPYTLDLANVQTPDQRDRRTSEIVMQHIAAELPPRLRGVFA